MNYYLEFFCKDNWLFLHYLFSFSIVYLYQNIYFILWDKIQCSLFYYIVLAGAIGNTLKLALVPIWDAPFLFVHFVQTFILSGVTRSSSSIFHAPLLESSISLRNSGIFYQNMFFRSQNLSTRGVHNYWSVNMVSVSFLNCFLFYSAFLSNSCLLRDSENPQALHIKVKIRSTVIVRHKFCFLNWC